jgi:metal-sulfur cluster biosynthetic enzyme
MGASEANLERWTDEVRDALATVCDPELDESVTELGFVQEISISQDGDVCVKFHLPTYWCSATFAYLMAADMQEAIARLAWAGEISIELLDHFTSAEISRGASSGKSFQEIFQAETEGNLAEIRLTFRRKSFQKRQEMLLRHLLALEINLPELLALSLDGLDGLDLDDQGRLLRGRYLQARNLLGFSRAGTQPALHDVEGRLLDSERFAQYLAKLRQVRLNTEFNAAICSGLLEVRYGSRQEDGLVQIEGMMTRSIRKD